MPESVATGGEMPYTPASSANILIIRVELEEWSIHGDIIPQRHALMETAALCFGLIQPYILMKLCAVTYEKEEHLLGFYEDVRTLPSGAEVAFPLRHEKRRAFLLSPLFCFA